MQATMKQKDIDKRMFLLRLWGDHCIICGESFPSLACVTFEHLVPRSFHQAFGLHGNLAPSHYNCNHTRQTLSLIEASIIVDRRRHHMGEKAFQQWIGKRVPNRDVPEIALLPVKDLLRLLKVI